VPGTSDGEGLWTEIAGDANLTQDIYFISLWVSGGSLGSDPKNHLLDLGVDPAGGTSYSAVISNIVCGASGSAAAGGGVTLFFPIFIKAGSAVAARIQGSSVTAGTVRIAASFFGQPSHPELIRVGQYAETIGTITGSLGVSFTPGNSGAAGTWVSLGTLTRACWWFQLCVQDDQATMTNNLIYHFDLAYGDSSNKHIIIQELRVAVTSNEEIRFVNPSVQAFGFADLPAGAELWVRGTCSATANTGWNAVAIGIGG